MYRRKLFKEKKEVGEKKALNINFDGEELLKT